VDLSLRFAWREALAEELNKEADDIEANIQAVDEKLVAGYWECANGHENTGAQRMACETGGDVAASIECKAPVKFIKLDQLTGQEKCESGKECKEAETIADNKGATAKSEEQTWREARTRQNIFQTRQRA
jgi:hypothetical protein